MAYATPLKSAQKVRTAQVTLPHRDSQNLVRFLSLLGFETNSFLNKTLFFVPNKDAFQQIMYFLFTCLDKGRCQSTFKDVWPIIDKKAEAEFRRLAFEWYKQIQSQHASRLPSITASLFHSPGGRKFLNFVNSFTRFVVAEKVERELEATAIQDPGAVPPSVIKQLTADNVKCTTEDLAAAKAAYYGGRDLADRLSGDFRSFKPRLSEVKSEKDALVREAEEVLGDKCDGCVSFEDIKKILDEEEQLVKAAASGIVETIDAFHKEVRDHFCAVCEALQITDVPGVVVRPRPVLDLSRFSTPASKSLTFNAEGKSRAAAEILETLFASAADRSSLKPVTFPLTQIEETVDFVMKERDKFLKMEYELNEQLPRLKEELSRLEEDACKRFLDGELADELFSPLEPVSFGTPQEPHTIAEVPFVLSDFPLTSHEISRRNRLLGTSSTNASISNHPTFEDTCTSDYFSYRSNHLLTHGMETSKAAETPGTRNKGDVATSPEVEMSGFSPCLEAVDPSVAPKDRVTPKMPYATPALFRHDKLLGTQLRDVFSASPRWVGTSCEKENSSVTKYCLSPSYYQDDDREIHFKEIKKVSKDLSDVLSRNGAHDESVGEDPLEARRALAELNKVSIDTPALFKDKKLLEGQSNELLNTTSPLLVANSGEKEGEAETPPASATKFCLSPSIFEDDDLLFCDDAEQAKIKKRIRMSERLRRCSFKYASIFEEDLSLVEDEDN